jgi:hypothetical protein
MNRPAQSSESRSRTSLRLEPEVWRRIDHAREKRPGNVSRNTWIAEAVLEKLKREAANDQPGGETNA